MTARAARRSRRPGGAAVLPSCLLAAMLALAAPAVLAAEAKPAAGSDPLPIYVLPAGVELGAERAIARAATERRDWTDALPRWRALEQAAPDDIDLLIESARVHGFADRNGEAAERYRQILAKAPQRRADLLPSLAWQTLWAGEPARAEPLFVEIAQQPTAFAGSGDGFDAWRGAAESRQHAGNLAGALAALDQARVLRPDDRWAARRRAQILAWLDRYDEAIAGFEALVASDPDDRASRYGLARARNFSGRHRQAVADYREAIARDRAAGEEVPNDARFDRARALRWAGYDELADQALTGLPQADARWLQDWRTRRETLRWLEAGYDLSTDRDDLDIRTTTAAFGWRPGPATSLAVGTRLVNLSEPGRHARGEQLNLRWRTRIGASEDAIGSQADPGPLWASVRLAANHYGSWQPLSGAAQLRWLATDMLRIEGGLEREIIETPLAVRNRVHVDALSVGADWRWRPGASVAGSVAALRFDDGNLRTRLNLRADQQLRANPKVVAGIEAMAFRASDPESDTRPGRGYWNPRRYHEARGYVAIGHEAWPWDFTLKLGLGTARETDGWGNRVSAKPHLWELSVAYDLARSLQLRAWAGGSGGSMGVGSGGEGYWRRYVGISVTGWF
ncbi:MAG: tetratricopeptide repeat protein [Burkholderiaceae bacterium]